MYYSELAGAEHPSSQVGVHGNETLAERINAETEGFQGLRSQKLGRVLGGKKREYGAFPPLEPNPDLGYFPDGCLAGCKDDALSVNGSMAKGNEQASWER